VIVLGVDPGSIRTGWGLVKRSGSKVSCLAAGVIAAEMKSELAQRLHVIFTGLTAVIQEHRPTVMAVEDIFYARSAKSALQLGHARGVVLLAGASSGLEVCAYPPALVKRSIAGRGRADKKQVAHMIGAILGWKELPPVDATDALAVAITHLNTAKFATKRRD